MAEWCNPRLLRPGIERYLRKTVWCVPLRVRSARPPPGPPEFPSKRFKLVAEPVVGLGRVGSQLGHFCLHRLAHRIGRISPTKLVLGQYFTKTRKFPKIATVAVASDLISNISAASDVAIM